MVETRQMDEEAYMYGGEEGFGGYIQDSDILDRPELFYGAPGKNYILMSSSLYHVYIITVLYFVNILYIAWQ